MITITLLMTIYSFKTVLAATAPDYGIYWFGKGNTSVKFVAGRINPNFNVSKPTVIFVHGLETGTVVRNFRETFNFKQNDPDNGVDVNSADAWINAGWNIGIFYWEQFSDEQNVTDAEAKIWTTTGPQKMRWKDSSGNYNDTAITKDAGQLFYDNYIQAMTGYTGNNVRIVGHSLGNQMATRLTQLVSRNVDEKKVPANLLPNRLSLLDPFWSKGAKDYLGGKWTGEECRESVSNLKAKGLAIELYRSTPITQIPFVGDENSSLQDMVVYSCYKPWFISTTNIGAKHCAASSIYFLSFNALTPKLYNRSLFGSYNLISGVAPSAAVNNNTIKTLMNSTYRYEQYTGVKTQICNDDSYARVGRSSILSVTPIN